MSDAAVRFVDVGQGDCIIAVDKRTGEGLLMDCPAGAEKRALAALNELAVTRLCVAIASHEHLDHLGGVYGIVTNLPTEKVKLNHPTSIPADRTERKKLRAAIRAIHGLPRMGISVESALAGESGKVGVVQWRIVAPDTPQLLHAGASSRPNHGSVVLRLSVNGAHVIASSDADWESWEAMTARGEELAAEVLQIPHHGAEFPSGGTQWTLDKVVRCVGAKDHVISVGSANNYGHPSPTSLARLRAQLPTSRLLCTQLNKICAACRLSANTSCAGDITFVFERGWSLVEPNPAEHRQHVESLPAPQCI